MLWHPDLSWFRDSPEPGRRDCLCSWCGAPIVEAGDDVRLWYGDAVRDELRFHALCFAYVANAEGLLFDDIEDLLLHWRQPYA